MLSQLLNQTANAETKTQPRAHTHTQRSSETQMDAMNEEGSVAAVWSRPELQALVLSFVCPSSLLSCSLVCK